MAATDVTTAEGPALLMVVVRPLDLRSSELPGKRYRRDSAQPLGLIRQDVRPIFGPLGITLHSL